MGGEGSTRAGDLMDTPNQHLPFAIHGLPDMEPTGRDDGAQRSWRFRQLQRTLQALAMAASEQLTLFPDIVVKPDELAFDFEHWDDVIRSNHASELTREQLAALAAIARRFETMARDAAEFDAMVWTDAALGASVEWEDIRRLARAALDAFGWTRERPLAAG